MNTRLIALTAACVLTGGALAQDGGSLMPYPGEVGKPNADDSTMTSDRQAALPVDPAAPIIAGEVHIDVVFVLDTTGSMGGMIDAAKRKIWSIANTMATAQPRPTIRIGLVGYRDRGDTYVTTMTPLTEDLDKVYADLLAYQAAGGGDGPESVNQALHEAVTKIAWTPSDTALKIVYLVGDAPPHMDYEQDISFEESCKLAATSGIIINTIQCGASYETARVWQQIARLAEGEYFAIDQSGGAVAITTPYDEEIAALDSDLDMTLMYFGGELAQEEYDDKMERSREIAAGAPTEARADRAIYKLSAAGRTTLGGSWDLLRAMKEGRVSLDSLEDDQLPDELKGKTREQQVLIVDAKTAQRSEIQLRLSGLAMQRQQFIDRELAATSAPADAFDQKVIEALARQAQSKGITIKVAQPAEDTPEKDPTDGGEPESTEVPAEDDAGTDDSGG